MTKPKTKGTKASKSSSGKIKPKTRSKSKSKSNSSTSATSKNASTSASVIGASRGAVANRKSTSGRKASKAGMSIAGNSAFEASNVKGRPKLCKAIAKVIGTKGALPLKSVKEMKSRGYEVSTKQVANQEGLRKGNGPKGKLMVCKLIELKLCTPRYKVTMERFSLKIMRFIGKKPTQGCFPKVYDIFLIDKKMYYIFMSECPDASLYDLVTGKKDIEPKRIRVWVCSLTEAVRELQKYGIAHRFIKLKHLMLDHLDHIKIVGWSKSVLFYDTKKKKALYQHKERRARKNNFLPPEAFHRLYCPSKADVWAIGVVLISLTTGRYPFHVRAKVKFSSQWRDFVKRHKMNPIVRSLANKIFRIDTKKRINARDMLAHNYFSVEVKQLQSQSVRGKPLASDAKSEATHLSTFKSKSYASHSATGTKSKSTKSATSSKCSAASKSASSSTKSASSSQPISSTFSGQPASGASRAPSKSKSGYSKGSSAPGDASRTSKMSNSRVGASATGNVSKTRSGKSTVGPSQSKSADAKPKSAKKTPKSKIATKSKAEKKKSTPKSKPKSRAKAKSAAKSGTKVKSVKSRTKPKSSAAKSAGKSKVKAAGVGATPTVEEEAVPEEKAKGKETNAKNQLDGISKQEMEAEADDAQAENEQAAEEAAEPVMDEVAKEGGGGGGEEGADGYVPPDGAVDVEGVADETEMQAPEEAKEQGTPAEMDAAEGQDQVVEEAAAGEVAEAGVGDEWAEEGAEGGGEAADEEWGEEGAAEAGAGEAGAQDPATAEPVAEDPAAIGAAAVGVEGVPPTSDEVPKGA